MTSFIIQGTSKPTPYTREKYPKLFLPLHSPYFLHTAPATTHGSGRPASEDLWPTPPGCGLFTPIYFTGIEEEREGRSKVEGSRSEYSPVRLFAQTFGAFIESTSYTQHVLKESVPPIFQSTEAFRTTMVGSKGTRSKTAAMAQSMTAQSHSTHDPAIDMVAPPPLATSRHLPDPRPDLATSVAPLPNMVEPPIKMGSLPPPT
ncbi:unnamed protein product [Prunus armeniaca]